MLEDTQQECRDCGQPYELWCRWTNPGAAGCRCHQCYLAYTRRRQTPNGPRPLVTHGGKPSGLRWRSLQERVWAEETHCGICGEYVDQTLHHNARMSRSIDHITPIALGGAMYERSNVRLAHRSCNSRQGNAIPSAERMQLLRASMWISARLGGRHGQPMLRPAMAASDSPVP